MKANIHPIWHHDCVVTCACGNKFTTGSTQTSLTVDICSQCHPFFTGEMRFVDRQGRVDKFMKRLQVAQTRQKEQTELRKRKQNKFQDKQAGSDQFRSYKQLLQQQKTAITMVKANKTETPAKTSLQ
jgi:large subunit ribosomal protein L31